MERSQRSRLFQNFSLYPTVQKTSDRQADGGEEEAGEEGGNYICREKK